jgi:uncharacterized protein (TIGR02466 family)
MALKKADRAVMFLQQGDLKQAASLFDQCRKKLSQPAHMHACTVTYFRIGRHNDAQSMLKKLVERVNITPQLVSLSGDINKAKGHSDAAIRDYRQAVSMAPQTPELQYNLALGLFDNLDLKEAIITLKLSLSLRPDYVRALILLGRCLAGTQQYSDALKTLTKSTSLEPANQTAHYRLGRFHLHRGNAENARKSLETALKINPQLSPAREALILNSIYSGEQQATTKLIQSALKSLPNDESLIAIGTDWAIEAALSDPYRYYQAAWLSRPTPSLFRSYANRLISMSDFDGAEKLLAGYASKFGKDNVWEIVKLSLLEIQNDFRAMIALIKSSSNRTQLKEQRCLAHFALGDYGSSYEYAKKLHDNQPKDQYYLALLATALRCLGDKDYKRLADYETLVLQADLRSQFGHEPQFTEYKDSLAKHLNQLHFATQAPAQQSVRGGTQTPGNLFAQNQNPLVAQLKQLISSSSQLFFEDLKTSGLDNSHPVISKLSKVPYLHASWSIRTAQGGFHESHVHSKGWYSSACYIDVPEVIDGKSDAGYLVFGKPPFKIKDELEPDYKIKPETGKLVLFPSYFWHATKPYEGVGERLVVAFDIGDPNLFV